MRCLLLFAAAAAAADPSCASLDDVSAALATLPSVVKPPQRRSEMTSQLRLLTEPPLPGLRSRCFRQRMVYAPPPPEWWRAEPGDAAAASGPLAPGERVGCLPAVLVIGAHKTGTTDMYHRLATHPDVLVDASRKESNFWCYAGQDRRNGWYDYAAGALGPVTRAVDEAWRRTHPAAGAPRVANAKDGGAFEGAVARAAALVGLDGTPANAYCRTGGAGRQVAPTFARAALGAGARVVAMVRDAADRAYSDYRYFASFQRARGAPRESSCALPKLPGLAPPFVYRYAPSPDHFDAVVRWEADRIDACAALDWDDRSCALWVCGVLANPPMAACPPGRLLLGFYDAFLEPWEKAFNCGEARLLRVRVEDVARRPAETMRRVAAFAGLDGGAAAFAAANRTRPEDAHDRGLHRGTRLPPMANGTRAFLDAFYARHAATRLPERLSCAAAPPRRLPAWERPPGGLS